MTKEAPEDSNPIEELLIRAYPNPERKGCPGRGALEDLGNLRVGRDHPAWYHIWHCSPCFSEFKTIRDNRWAKEERESRRKNRLVAASALAVLIAIGCTLFVFLRTPARSAPEIATITLDLHNAKVLRGIDQGPTIKLPPLPRKIDDLHIILPMFSEPGAYTIAVLRSRDNASAIALASGIAKGNQKRMEITVRLDLRRARPGEYVLGTRHDSNELVYYYPVTIT